MANNISVSKDVVLTFKNQISIYEKQILPSLLEKHGINPEQFVQVVVTAVKQDDKLLKAFQENPASLFASILAGAEIGLMPRMGTGEFYLIPRNIKQSDGKYKLSVTPLIGYQGLVNILLRSGEYVKIWSEVVYEGDEFEVSYGLEPKIHHKPNFDAERTAERIKYVYAIAKSKHNEFQFNVMTRKEIEAVKNMNRYENDLYFNDKQNPNRWMEKKTALIQLSKMLHKDYYSKNAIGVDNMIQGGSLLTLDENNQVKVIEGTPIKPPRYRNLYGSLTAPPPDTDIIDDTAEK